MVYNQIHFCTYSKPMPEKPDPGRWVHSDAYEVPESQEDGFPGGDTVLMRCPHCKYQWRKELPQ